MSVLTLGQVGEIFGLPTWKIRRLYERGLLPAASRVGNYRVVNESDLASIESVIKSEGYVRMADQLLQKEELAPTQEATEGA
jgi:hypothetical protein